MLTKVKHNLAILAARQLLNKNKSENLSTAKRLVSVIAGAYIFQRGLKAIFKHPVIGIQETILGSFLMYDAVSGIRDTYPKRPKELSEVRKNQIQGNDPSSPTPAFV